MNIAEKILRSEDLPRKQVIVREWTDPDTGEPITVWVRAITGSERDQLESSLLEDKQANKPPRYRARLLALTVTDEHGNRIFQEDQVDALGKKSAKALERLINVAQKLNGLGEEDIEELSKN